MSAFCTFGDAQGGWTLHIWTHHGEEGGSQWRACRDTAIALQTARRTRLVRSQLSYYCYERSSKHMTLASFCALRTPLPIRPRLASVRLSLNKPLGCRSCYCSSCAAMQAVNPSWRAEILAADGELGEVCMGCTWHMRGAVSARRWRSISRRLD